MRDTGTVVLTFFGSIIFCTAIVGTVQSFLDSGAGNGPMVGGVAIGVGLAMLLIPWLRDDATRRNTAAGEESRISVAA